MKDKQIPKNIQPGTNNTLADGATLLSDGSRPEHHAHVKKVTPLDTKAKEIMADPQYSGDAIDKARETRTTRLRRDKEVRPL